MSARFQITITWSSLGLLRRKLVICCDVPRSLGMFFRIWKMKGVRFDHPIKYNCMQQSRQLAEIQNNIILPVLLEIERVFRILLATKTISHSIMSREPASGFVTVGKSRLERGSKEENRVRCQSLKSRGRTPGEDDGLTPRRRVGSEWPRNQSMAFGIQKNFWHCCLRSPSAKNGNCSLKILGNFDPINWLLSNLYVCTVHCECSMLRLVCLFARLFSQMSNPIPIQFYTVLYFFLNT